MSLLNLPEKTFYRFQTLPDPFSLSITYHSSQLPSSCTKSREKKYYKKCCLFPDFHKHWSRDLTIVKSSARLNQWMLVYNLPKFSCCWDYKSGDKTVSSRHLTLRWWRHYHIKGKVYNSVKFVCYRSFGGDKAIFVYQYQRGNVSPCWSTLQPSLVGVKHLELKIWPVTVIIKKSFISFFSKLYGSFYSSTTSKFK